MKKAITTASLISGLLMAGIGSYASAQNAAPAPQGQPGQMHGPMQGHHEEGRGEHRRGHDPVDAAQKRLGQLKQKLNLKPGQQAAWDTYSSSMIARVRAHVAEHEKLEGKGPRDQQNVSTPERMERMATMMRSGADNMSKAAADTKVFYDGLSVEQRTIFDLTAQNAWKERMGHDGRHGHDMH